MQTRMGISLALISLELRLTKLRVLDDHDVGSRANFAKLPELLRKDSQ